MPVQLSSHPELKYVQIFTDKDKFIGVVFTSISSSASFAR